MNSGLSEQNLAEISDALKAVPSIQSAVLFGSRVSGAWSPASDVDIALKGERITLQELLQISARLNENRDLLRYDVIRYASITNRALIEQIDQAGVVIYER